MFTRHLCFLVTLFVCITVTIPSANAFNSPHSPICLLSVEKLVATHEGFESSFFSNRPPLHVLAVRDGGTVYPSTPFELAEGGSWEDCFHMARELAQDLDLPFFVRWELKSKDYGRTAIASGLLDSESPWLPESGDLRFRKENERNGEKINSAKNCRACYIEFFDFKAHKQGWLVLKGTNYPLDYTPQLFMVKDRHECQAYAEDLLKRAKDEGFHFRAHVYTSGDRSTCRIPNVYSRDFWAGRFVIRFAQKVVLCGD